MIYLFIFLLFVLSIFVLSCFCIHHSSRVARVSNDDEQMSFISSNKGIKK